MKLLRMYVRPFGEAATPPSITSAKAAEILAMEFPEVSGDPLDWERLFDPQLDLRVQLDQMVSVSLAEFGEQEERHLPLYTDGLDNAYAVVTRETVGLKPDGWFISVSRQHLVSMADGHKETLDEHGYAVHLVLHDDDQAERIKVALAELNPEARRFLRKET